MFGKPNKFAGKNWSEKINLFVKCFLEIYFDGKMSCLVNQTNLLGKIVCPLVEDLLNVILCLFMTGKVPKVWWESEMQRPSIRERIWQMDPIIQYKEPVGIGKLRKPKYVIYLFSTAQLDS